MTSIPTAQAGTALSPEWDRGFDEAFAELVTSDSDLVQAEFDALIGACWNEPPEPPAPPAPPAPSAARPAPPQPDPGCLATQPAQAIERHPDAPFTPQRSPP